MNKTKSQIAEYKHQEYLRHRHRYLTYQHNYYYKNQDIILSKIRQDRQQNPDLIRVKENKYWAKNKDKKSLKDKKYRIKYPVEIKIKKLIRMPLKECKSKITDITYEWLYNLYINTPNCQVCGIELVDQGNKFPNGKQIDHIIPKITGGTHTMDNVRFVCFKCNMNRGKKHYKKVD